MLKRLGIVIGSILGLVFVPFLLGKLIVIIVVTPSDVWEFTIWLVGCIVGVCLGCTLAFVWLVIKWIKDGDNNR